MKKSVLMVLVALLLLLGCGEPPLVDVRESDGVPLFMQNGMPYFSRLSRSDHERQDLAGAWKFTTDPSDAGTRDGWFEQDYDDSAWETHPVPGVWNTQKPAWLHYVGAGWYRRSFTVPGDWKGRFNRLTLDGVSFHADLYLNGRLLARHSGGYTRWSVDVSDDLHYGKPNLLVLRVSNRLTWDTLPPRTGGAFGWWPYGGIAREVALESAPQTTLAKLAVDADHQGMVEGSGVIYRHGSTETEARVKVRLCDLAGQELKLLLEWPVKIGPSGIAVFRFKDRLENARPWSPETPGNRYLVEVEVRDGQGGERQSVEIGFRSFSFKDGRAWLNGKPVVLRGVNRHEDDPETGPVQTEARMAEDLELLARLHANFVRTSHYPADPAWLDACDRRGILVATEIPLYQVGWTWKGMRAVQRPELRRQAATALLEMIERDRNHPAVVCWGLGNEGATIFPSIARLFRDLYAEAKRFDARRPAVLAIMNLPLGVSPLLDRAAGIGDALFINEYYGWYYGRPADVGRMLDAFHEKWPDRAIVVSETGAAAAPGLKQGGSWPIGFGARRDYTEANQERVLAAQLPVIFSRPYVAGVAVWCFADFRDEQRARAPVPYFNLKGLVSYDRKPKKAFATVAEIYRRVQDGPEKAKDY